jgi:hypothetical protein
MLLDRSIVGRSRWWLLKFSSAPSASNKCYQKCGPSGKMERNCSVLANSRWEMLLKVIGQPLGNDKRLLDSLWAILRGYWKVAEKCPNSSHQPIGDKAALLSGYWLKRGNFHPFSLKCLVSVYIY